LRLQAFDLVAEIKDASPSAGSLNRAGHRRAALAEAYANAGAAAISVLTEPSRFAGELSHLSEVAEVAAALGVPVMRKDFLTAPAQVIEARAAGASGVLLIAAMLGDAQLQDMLDCAWAHSMFVLLESFDEHDLQRTTALLGNPRHADKAQQGQLLAGVNSRNLRTLEVDDGRLVRLSALLPPAVPAVAESGLSTARDAADVAALGYRLALVGSALMQSDEPQALASAMIAAGRGACACS
jgi:indole-3-glycerol phosphate synthase